MAGDQLGSFDARTAWLLPYRFDRPIRGAAVRTLAGPTAAAKVPAARASDDGADGNGLPATGFEPVGEEWQEAEVTASRRAQPRAWLQCVVWLVSSGLHPRAYGTTVRVAEDLARRMDYIEGRVLFDLEGTARRLRVSRATVKRHVRVLRELGALVWLVHGSKRNLQKPGRRYTATATVYGAAVPPVYDEAMGHRITGSGYGARVCGVTDAGRERAITEARRRQAAGDEALETVDDEAVDNPREGGCEPPSLGCRGLLGAAEVSGGFNYTRRRARKSQPATSPCDFDRSQSPAPRGRKRGRDWAAQDSRNIAARNRRRSERSRGRTPSQARRDVAIAEQVRAVVPWVRPQKDLRRLAFVLRPLIDAAPDPDAVACTLLAWSWTWRRDWAPQQPAAYISARLTATGLRQPPTAATVARQQQLDAERDAARRQATAEEAARRAAVAARPCTDCGKSACSGLCAICDYTRRLSPVLRDAILAGIVLRTNPRDAEAVQRTVTDCHHDTLALLNRHSEQLRSEGATDLHIALETLDHAEKLRDRRRTAAVRCLSAGPDAVAAANRAYQRAVADAQHSSRSKHLTPQQIHQAEQAADQASHQVAQRLLTEALAPLTQTAAVHLPGGQDRTSHTGAKIGGRCRSQGVAGAHCDRPALPERTVCLRHHAAELA